MIPTRVTHNPIIGPGVVPMGVDPAYDAQYAKHGAPTRHVASHGNGRPFVVEPATPNTNTQMPYVTGTTVLGMKYKGGVMIACDTLGASPLVDGSARSRRADATLKSLRSRDLRSSEGRADLTFPLLVSFPREQRAMAPRSGTSPSIA
jgi:hypothetical protein|tara:strand:- start:2655 stop:3098 length:444 start_codon:yes stop_codon:yes gene_type:complete|eukprot:31032-Pelagococcus_subviridis.AAC.28